jgi:hypothetical protein
MARKPRASADPSPIPLDADLARLWPSHIPRQRELLLLLQRARNRNRAEGRNRPPTSTTEGTPVPRVVC